MIIWGLFVFLLIIISLNDFIFFRIENEYVLTLLILYGISCFFNVSGSNFIQACTVVIAVSIVTFLLNHFNLIGGGDVKLLIPLLLFVENDWWNFILGTSVGGIIISFFYIFLRKRIFYFRHKIISILFQIKKKKIRLLRFILLSLYKISERSIKSEKLDNDPWRQEIPYGVALSCGGILVVLNMIVR